MKVKDVANRLYTSTTLSRRSNTSSSGPSPAPPPAESGKLPCIIARTAFPVNLPDWKFVEDRRRTFAADL